MLNNYIYKILLNELFKIYTSCIIMNMISVVKFKKKVNLC